MTPATVVAFLTILGFSLYDTVVVFDKVKENQARLGTVRGDTYSPMVNRSLNQVLMRSINTSIVALLPGGVAAVRRHLRARRARAARLRARAVRRPAHGRVLVDLRGHAGPRVAQGARAQVPLAAGARRRRPGQGEGRRAGRAGRRRRTRSTCRSTARTSTPTTIGPDVDEGDRRATTTRKPGAHARRGPCRHRPLGGAAKPRGRQQRRRKRR